MAATLDGGKLAYGTFVAVDQTVMTRVLLYVLQYDDGDIERLEEARAFRRRAISPNLDSGPEDAHAPRCRRPPTCNGCNEADAE